MTSKTVWLLIGSALVIFGSIASLFTEGLDNIEPRIFWATGTIILAIYCKD